MKRSAFHPTAWPPTVTQLGVTVGGFVLSLHVSLFSSIVTLHLRCHIAQLASGL
jgi:hypothetical protein